LCIVQQARQPLDCIVDRQLRFVRVNLRGELHIAVPHQLHREPLRDVVPLQKRRPGIAQSVEIGIAPRLVAIFDAVALRINFQPRGARDAVRENQSTRREVPRTIWWVMVAEAEQVIKIPDAVGKIDARRVPILPNLAVRLQRIPLETKHERVAVDWSIANSLYHAWKRICEKAGVPYKRNAFRKSYFSYRLVVLDGDLKKVSDEGGTSEKMLKKQYLSRGAISQAMAEEWFSL
jgi:hypothetical protein